MTKTPKKSQKMHLMMCQTNNTSINTESSVLSSHFSYTCNYVFHNFLMHHSQALLSGSQIIVNLVNTDFQAQQISNLSSNQQTFGLNYFKNDQPTNLFIYFCYSQDISLQKGPFQEELYQVSHFHGQQLAFFLFWLNPSVFHRQ